MEQGLAEQMVYGTGEGQNTTHYYVGTQKTVNKNKKREKKVKKSCKK